MMKKELRCVGYVKPMDSMEILAENKRIPVVNVEAQKNHIHYFARKNGLSLDRIYYENDIGEIKVYKQLCENAVHREFDVLILYSLFCFGTTIHAAADFIENVMLPAGFQIIVLEAGERNLTEYIHACCERFRIAQSQIKYFEKGKIPHRGTYGITPEKKRENTMEHDHDLVWYEARQKELFEAMLKQDERFAELEEELKHCRTMIKKLRS